METNYAYSEQQAVLHRVNELVNKVEREAYKFSALDPDTNYILQTYEECTSALSSRMDKLKKDVEELRQINLQIDSAYEAKIQEYLSSFEKTTGWVERDEDHNLHCGDCLISYNFGQNLVGKKVKLSGITLNTNGRAAGYPVYANHVEVVKEEQKQLDTPSQHSILTQFRQFCWGLL